MTMPEHWPVNTDPDRAPPQIEVIILAAGQGQRFEASGGQGHKALAPIWDQRGTLELLLSRLRKCGDQRSDRCDGPLHLPVTVVTGRWADSIQAVAQRYNANVVHNPDYASATLLQSLVYAIKHRCTSRVSGASCVGCVSCGICGICGICVSQADRILVLFADTLYSLKALQTLVQACLQEAESDPGLECLSTGQETGVSTSHHTQNPLQTRPQPCALVAISPAPAKPERSQVGSTASRSVSAEDPRGNSVDRLQASSSTDIHHTGAWPEQTGVRVTNDDKVLRFDDPDSEWQMAHAVVWPRHMVTRLVEVVDIAQQTNLGRQWQVLQQIIKTSKPATSKVRAVRLPAWSTFDVDTVDDLTALQHDHRVRQEHLEYFDSYVSKERTLGSEPDALLDQVYLKYCESAESARHEFRVLRHLHTIGPDVFANPVGVHGRCLELNFASGIRLYDLLVRTAHHPRGRAVESILLRRCLHRLHRMQAVLLQESHSIASQPYPFSYKIIDLLATLNELLSGSGSDSRAYSLSVAVKTELEVMQSAWNRVSTIPFRDATPKNIIIAIPALAPMAHLTSMTQREQALAELMDREDAFWESVPIVDIDFTSTRDLTVPEDDVISLLGHHSTVRFLQGEYERLPLLPGLEHSVERTDLAWFVRYLRFGGRKLLYKLLNPIGFAVRFRYDEPCFYFEQLPRVLSKEFRDRYPAIFGLLLRLRDHAERYRGEAFSEGARDHYLAYLSRCDPTLRESSFQSRYWQESPLEWQTEHV